LLTNHISTDENTNIVTSKLRRGRSKNDLFEGRAVFDGQVLKFVVYIIMRLKILNDFILMVIPYHSYLFVI